jgi:Fur family ferric uptake transcriptional regulator
MRALYGGARMSVPRSVIADAVLAQTGAFTAEDLHRALAEGRTPIGLATVYRALGAMQVAGSVAVVGQRDGSALLARCGRDDHHHHLVCTSCGRVVGIDCPLGREKPDAVTRDGHLVTRHEITLYGLCSTCRTEEGED